MTIKITKQLATMEDLAIGTGTVVQERNGVPLTLTKIDLITASKLASSVTGEGASLVLMESGLTVEAIVNANQTEVDALTASVSNSVGDVSLFAGNSTSLNKKYGQGWRIADGSNGTPNLIDSFPKMGTFAQRTGTGGSKSIVGLSVDNHTLTESQMPRHNHNTTIFSNSGTPARAAPGQGFGISQSTSLSGDAGSSGSHNHNTSSTPDANEPQFTYLVPLYFTGVAGSYS